MGMLLIGIFIGFILYPVIKILIQKLTDKVTKM